MPKVRLAKHILRRCCVAKLPHAYNTNVSGTRDVQVDARYRRLPECETCGTGRRLLVNEYVELLGLFEQQRINCNAITSTCRHKMTQVFELSDLWSEERPEDYAWYDGSGLSRSLPLYQYSALDASQIRLLHLQPGTGRD